MKKKLLCFYTSDYDDIVKKGVIESYYLFKEKNYFNEVLLVCPFARTNKKVDLGNGVKVLQYGWKSRIEFLNRFRITKAIGSIVIIFKLLFVLPIKVFVFNPTIIRSTDPYYLGLIGLSYSVHSDYQKCFISGGFTFTIFGSRLIPLKIEKFVYDHSDMILPISEYLKNVIVNTHKISVQKINVIYHGMDFNAFDSEKRIDIYEKFKISKDLKIISYVARLSKEKNSLDILELVEKLKNNRTDFVMLVAGDGPERSYMEKYIHDRSLEKYIRLLGFQKRNIVISLREQCRVSICLFDGHSLIEACAASRPVVAYDVEWHSELIKNEITGFLVREHDIDDLSNKVSFLLDNDELADQMGKNARDTAFEMLNIDKTISVKQACYNKLIED